MLSILERVVKVAHLPYNVLEASIKRSKHRTRRERGAVNERMNEKVSEIVPHAKRQAIEKTSKKKDKIVPYANCIVKGLRAPRR